jgi:hypothetical protein
MVNSDDNNVAASETVITLKFLAQALSEHTSENLSLEGQEKVEKGIEGFFRLTAQADVTLPEDKDYFFSMSESVVYGPIPLIGEGELDADWKDDVRSRFEDILPHLVAKLVDIDALPETVHWSELDRPEIVDFS